VLIFRHSALVGCDMLSVLFVVGETPTSGIQKPAFAEALRERDALVKASTLATPGTVCSSSTRLQWDADTKRESKLVRVLGPTFSGSSASLRRELDRWLDKHSDGRVAVVTGAANAPANREILIDAQGRITFSSTINRVDLVIDALQKVLDTLDVCPGEIAYLRESTTPFGQALVNTMRAEPDASAPGGHCRTREWKPGTNVVPPPLQIPFPLNISSLRSQYSRLPQPVTTGQPGQAQAPEASFDLGDSAAARETPRVTSGLTAAMVELALNDIVATLTIHRVKVVVIIATDVRDRLFIASEVKRRLPDVMTVLVGANSLYLRPELTSDLRGALVLTTYPLVLETQFWDLTQSRDRQRFPFTSDLAEGIFNATLLQLGDSRDMVDYGYPARPPAEFTLSDSTCPAHLVAQSDTTRPPIWITMIGRTSFLPVTAIPINSLIAPQGCVFTISEPSDSPYVYARAVADTEYRVRTEPDSRGLLGKGLLIVIVAVAVGCLAILWNSSRRWVALFQHQADWSAKLLTATPNDARVIEHWQRVRSDLMLDRESWVFFRFTALFGLLAPIALLMFHSRIHGRPEDAGTTWVSGGLGVLSAAAFVYFLVSAMRRAWAISATVEPRDWSGLRRFGGLALAGVLYFLLVSFFMFQALDIGGAQAGIFFVRALQFGSGVTPLLPLFLGGLVLSGAAVWNVSRVRQLSDLSAFEAGWIQESLPKDHAPRLAGWSAWLEEFRNGTRGAVEAIRRPAAARGERVDQDGALSAAVAAARERLSDVSPGTPAQLTLILLLIAGLVFAWQKQPSPERLALPCSAYPAFVARLCGIVPVFDLLLTSVIIAAMILLIWDLMRFWSVWHQLRRCLEVIGTTPIMSAFATLPLSVAQLGKLSTFVPPSEALVTSTLDAAADERWAELGALPDATKPPTGTMPRGGRPPLRSLDCAFDADAGAGFLAIYQETRKPGGSGRPDAPRNAPQVYREMVALYFIEYVERIMRQLRVLAGFILATIFVTILLLSSYPFAPESLIKSSFLIVMALTIGAMLSVLFQRNRNPTLRAIAQGEPDGGTWNVQFILHLLLVLGVPLLALLSSTFPEVRSILFSWIAPLLQALSKG
jgi:hypothetical protein